MAGTYGADQTYKANGASATTTTATKSGSAVGGLPTEVLTMSYNGVGQVKGLVGAQTYVQDTSYSYDGQVAQQILGVAGKQVRRTLTYQTSTRRLQQSSVDTENQAGPGTWDTARAVDDYSYDNAGNVTSAAGKTNAVADQAECYRYDWAWRLTDAWSQSSPSGCVTPQAAGADPYRLHWDFDAAGDRSSETSYNAGGAVVYSSTYAYGGAGFAPHELVLTATLDEYV